MKKAANKSACRTAEDFLPGGFVRQRGKAGQIQLLNAVVKQFKSCVPRTEAWRVFRIQAPTMNSTPSGAARFKYEPLTVYVMVLWWTGTKADLTAFVAEKKSFSSETEHCIVFATPDLDIDFDVSRKFPSQYLDQGIRKL